MLACPPGRLVDEDADGRPEAVIVPLYEMRCVTGGQLLAPVPPCDGWRVALSGIVTAACIVAKFIKKQAIN